MTVSSSRNARALGTHAALGAQVAGLSFRAICDGDAARATTA
jgi:hypothetical protein